MENSGIEGSAGSSGNVPYSGATHPKEQSRAPLDGRMSWNDRYIDFLEKCRKQGEMLDETLLVKAGRDIYESEILEVMTEEMLELVIALGRTEIQGVWFLEVENKEAFKKLWEEEDWAEIELIDIEEEVVTYKVHWGVTAWAKEIYENFFERFGEVMEFERVKKEYKGVKIEAGIIRIKLKLKKNAAEIPQFVKIRDFTLLVQREDKKKKCFRCKKEGHLSRQCQKVAVEQKAVELKVTEKEVEQKK